MSKVVDSLASKNSILGTPYYVTSLGTHNPYPRLEVSVSPYSGIIVLLFIRYVLSDRFLTD